MNIGDLGKLLNSASSNEWLYVQQSYTDVNEFKITEGYWDKFCVCIIDIFSGFSLAGRTQEAVLRVLNDQIQELKQDEHKPKYFQSVEKVECYQSIFSNLSKFTSVWGQQFKALPDLQAQHLPSFDQQINEMYEIYDILPPKEQLKYQAQIKGIQDKLDSYQDLSVSNIDKITSWLTIARFLKQCKEAWLALEQPTSASFLDNSTWYFKIGKWEIEPQYHSFKTASNYEKNLSYLYITFQSTTMRQCWEADMRQHLEDKGDNTDVCQKNWEDEQIHHQIDTIFQFLNAQIESQKRPITIDFPYRRTYHRPFSKFMDSLIEGLKDKMEKNPDCFIHQAALFAEIALQEQGQKISSVCLSRLTQNSEEYYIRAPFLRLELQPLISTLEKAQKKKIGKLTTVAQLQQLEMQLMNLVESHDFTIRLYGKDKGCCKAVLIEAFPLLKAREGNKGKLQGADPNLLNLDSFALVRVDSNYVEWILNSLLVFAYSRQHPIMSTQQTLLAKEAFTAYCTLIDYLRPSSFSLDISLESN